MTAADPTAPDLPLTAAGPIEAYLRFWRRYALFTGRASRSEFWWVALANVVVFGIIGIVGGLLVGIGGAMGDDSAAVLPRALGAIVTLLLGAYFLAVLVPSIALSIRRLHDADLSGLFFLLALVPSVGGLILVVLHLLPSSPTGRRFDVGGGTSYVPPPPPPPLPVAFAAPAYPTPVFDRDRSAPSAPATSPLPVAEPMPEVAAPDVWSLVGAVQPIEPPMSADPSWRRQRYVRVTTAAGATVLGTDGLSASEGLTALGAGAELWIATTDLAALPAADLPASWQLAVAAGAARRIRATGVHLPAELEEYGSLSMSLAVPGAPAGWIAPDGSLGVLLGVGRVDVPDTVAAPRGEVRLVGVVPLRPEELQRIVEGGRAVREQIRTAIGALPTAVQESPDRPAV